MKKAAGRGILFLVAALLTTSPAAAEPYSWREVSGALAALSSTFRTADLVPPTTGDDIYGRDVRQICADDAVSFVAKVVREGCRDGGCAERQADLVETAERLVGDLERRLGEPGAVVGNGAELFLPPGLTFAATVEQPVDSLKLRAAHDLWLRGWMDPLSISGERTERDAWLLLSRTWCGVTQSNALAAAAYLEANGFKSTDRGLPPTIVNIAIHAAWNPTLTGPLRLQTETAFERGEVAGYYAGQLIDIDAMASAGGQKIGTLYSCEGGIAYLDPPLLDGEGSEHLRARYGFQPLAVSLATRSRSCASAAD